MPASMTIEQKIPFTVAYTTAAGKPAIVDGSPVTTVSDATLAHVDGAVDGMSGFIIADGVGDIVVTVTADADMGGGVMPIVVTDTLSIIAAGAAAGTFGFGTPIAK